MANIRNLKKNIDLQIYEVISDCLTWSEVHKKGDADGVSGILADAVTLRNDLIHRINHAPASADAKVVRAHFLQIQTDLTNGIDGLFKKLSSVSKKKAR